MLSIKQKYITQNACYKQGKSIVPKGIIVHSLGVPQPDIDKVYASFNNVSAKTAVHAAVNNTNIYQFMPWTYRPWGCGSGPNGSGNDSYIQFEICEPSGFKYKPNSTIMDGYDIKKQQSYFDAIWNNAVDLATYLCGIYKLSASTIICHSEAHTKGIASNHGDVMHWFPKHGKNMDDFRKAVADKMTYLPKSSISKDSSKEDIKWLQEKLNKALPQYTYIPLDNDGVYGRKTRIAVLMYWEMREWDQDASSGWTVGTGTISALSKLK